MFDRRLSPCPPNRSDHARGRSKRNASTLRVIGWFSVGMAVAAVGIYLGRELRSRYKFKRRTPYDFYSNAGEQQPGEFGNGNLGHTELNPNAISEIAKCRLEGGILHLCLVFQRSARSCTGLRYP